MFEYGDEVTLTEESCAYYEDADPSLWDLCGVPLTVIGIEEREDGAQICDVETEDGECFTFYDFELEFD